MTGMKPFGGERVVPLKLTGARRRGLAVLSFGAATGRAVRESNVTTLVERGADPRTLTVYWQTAQWLEQQGYVTIRGVDRVLELTDYGRDIAEALS